MVSKRIPRAWLLAAALGVAASVILLSIFYGQYRWLADEIVTASSEQHYEIMRSGFERRSRARIRHLAGDLSAAADVDNGTSIQSLLDRAVASGNGLTGLRLALASGAVLSSGVPVSDLDAHDVVWSDYQLLIPYPVTVSYTHLRAHET